ncbi:MAG: putative Tyrosine recombinase xerD [Candidatus Parcubacteria bacterium]|jgi:site-specific recombinase XerD
MASIDSLLTDYLNYLEIEKNRSPKTRENYERYLKKFIAMTGVRSPADITDTAVRNFRIQLARHRQSSNKEEHEIKKVTQSYYVIAVRNFLKYLAKRDIPTLAAEKIELPKIARRDIDVLDYKDLERLVAAPSGQDLRSLRDRAILETFFSTGLRLAELCRLDRTVDLERGEISVRGKGDKLRVVFLSGGAKRSIKAYLAKRGDMEQALFVSLSKTPKGSAKPPKVIGRIIPRAVERLVEHWAKVAGIPKHIHPHQLRHSFATDLLVNGADLRSVQELLGHANVATTQVYTHLTNKELRDVHEAFHARRRKDS